MWKVAEHERCVRVAREMRESRAGDACLLFFCDYVN